MERKPASHSDQLIGSDAGLTRNPVATARGGVWISWHNSRRSQTLSAALGIPLIAVQFEGPSVLRHGMSALWTLFQIARWRPRVIFTQHSFLLSLILALYSRVWPWPVLLIVDTHTKALKRELSGALGPLFRILRAWSFARADAVVVANPMLERLARNLCPRVVVVPDPLPEPISPALSIVSREHCRPYIVFPASGDADEPWEALLVVAARVETVDFVVTGMSPDRPEAAKAPGNVRFSGWLPEQEYWSLLHGAAGVLALTRLEDCSQCAAVEALACGVPVIATCTPTLMDELGDAAVYVRMSLDDLPVAVSKLMEQQSSLRRNVSRWRQERSNLEKTSVEVLISLAWASDGVV